MIFFYVLYIFTEILALSFRHQNKTFCFSKLNWMFLCQTTIVCMFNMRGSKSSHLMLQQDDFCFYQIILLQRELIILRVMDLITITFTDRVSSGSIKFLFLSPEIRPQNVTSMEFQTVTAFQPSRSHFQPKCSFLPTSFGKKYTATFLFCVMIKHTHMQIRF